MSALPEHLRQQILDLSKLMMRPLPMFPKALTDALHSPRMVVMPGDAHWTESFCPETGAPQSECRCQHCAPTTLPTAFPAAPAAPELCKLAYYGIRCTNPACQDEIHREKRNPT